MDPYVYPGTDVLKNLRDLRDDDQLSDFEAIATNRRIAELLERDKPGKFDLAHLQSTHRYIFQDVYDWAGAFRTVNIARPGQFYFAFAGMIVPALGELLDKLLRESYLANFDAERFSTRAAYYMGELNAIHPFRDGNGRTQREFVRQLARAASHTLNWSRVTRPQIYEASHRSFQRADHAGLAEVILAAIA